MTSISYFVEIELPKVSIITVAYNAEALIEKTIKSVIGQTYPNLEYILIDGASTDNTLAIAQKYEAAIDRIISEPDKNNYDAMNKGMHYATGDYIWFLHAGDLILDNETLAEAMQNKEGVDFIYGKALILGKEGQEKAMHKAHPDAKTLTWKSFRNGMLICHQAMILHRRAWLPYRHEKYPLVADIDWIIRAMQRVETVADAGIYLCGFLEGGISARNRRRSLIERFKVLREHFGLLPTLWEHLRISLQALRRGSMGNQ